MKIKSAYILIMILGIAAGSCNSEPETKVTKEKTSADSTADNGILEPVYITKTVRFDTDDPAIWVHPEDVSKSLIIGTDKDVEGGLYKFNLQGEIVGESVALKRPNNVDIATGFSWGDSKTDIAVAAERVTSKIRIFRLPEMQAIDNGGIDAFVDEDGEEFRDLMGIATYKNPDTEKIYVIVGRKNGPTDGTYLWQYELATDGEGYVTGKLIRKFGKFSGTKEIEAIAVDNEMGYVYYSDEQVGIRKYYADPAKGNEELALFGEGLFAEDNEGIAISKTGEGKGYIIVSDQGAGKLRVFPREGSSQNPHLHESIGYVNYKAVETDGIEISNVAFNSDFPEGILVAMSDDKTFHMYSLKDVMEAIKK